MLLHIIVVLFCFICHVIGGIYRARQAKFSQNWFLGVYIPLFLSILALAMNKTPLPFVLLSVLALGAGQGMGRKFQEKRLSSKQIEAMEQLQDLQLPMVIPKGIKDQEIAIVLMNMGGPCCLDSVEVFLRRLFNDALIIRFPFAQSFFADILIKARLKEVKSRYKLIGGGSPILASSSLQVKALKDELARRGRKLDVFLSFNYSYPLPQDTIHQVKQLGKKHILPLSLYPHYSQSTTASNIFYLKDQAKKDYPELNFLGCYSYHLYEGYIQAFVDRIHESIKPSEKLEDFYLLFSAHGTPLYFLQEGDPYSFLVSQSISQILKVLKRNHSWSICYQSAVGPLVWLKPSTDAAIKALAQRGVKKVIVVPISFVTDHIETLCEIDIEYRHLAKTEGITDFRMSKAIECHPTFIQALADCVENSLK